MKPALRAIYPVADQPVHPADADDQRRLGDLGLRADLGRGQRCNRRPFRSFEIYFVVAGIYLAHVAGSFSALFELIYRRTLNYPDRPEEHHAYLRISRIPLPPRAAKWTLALSPIAFVGGAIAGLVVALARTSEQQAGSRAVDAASSRSSRARRC